MKSLIKGAALFVAVACLVWIIVLWRWRAMQREMDGGDMVLYLVVLPAVVFGLLLAARWAVRGALARQDAKAAAAAAATPGATSAAAGASAATRDAATATPWHVLGAWSNTAGGASVDDLLAAIEAGDPRPKPDTALHDDDGLPVLTARIADLDDDAVAQDLRRGAPDARTAPPARAARALASLAPLVDECVQSLSAWAEQWTIEAERASAVGAAAPPADADRIVRVLVAWPADWDDATCAGAQAWLAARLCDPLADVLPLARWTIRGQRMSGNELLAAAERTMDVLRRQERDDPVLLMACHSDLDATAIRALERDQRLFHAARRPKAAMPGEGAALLALSAVEWPEDAAIEPERVRLDSPAIVRRSESIESGGRTSSDDAVRLVTHGLATAGIQGKAIAKLASDADQHTARATELFAVSLALLPSLDATEDMRLAGTIAGRLEAAAPLLTIALAAAQARESGQPALALSLADSHWRMAAVLRPSSFKPEPQAS